jgi:hypothetical protein
MLGLCLLVAFAAAPQPGPLRAGVATSVITPRLGTSINGGMRDRRAAHIHDELHARCLVLDNGQERIALAVCDSCMIPRAVIDAAKAEAQERTGIPADHMLVCATHTHSAPTASPVFQSDPDPAYTRFLAGRIADGIRRAHNNLAPARLGWAVGTEPTCVFNRRWHMKPGTIPPDPFGGRTDRVKMNPPAGSANLLEPAGPTDPDVPVIALQRADGTPLALLATYSLHYVGGTGAGHISADYFGMFCDRMQHLIGADRLDPPFVAMLTNGTSADINNINFRKKRTRVPPYAQMRAVAHTVAGAAHRAYRTITYRDRIPLAVRQRTLKLGVRRPTEAELERARAILARAEGPVLRSLEEVYARETVLLAEYPPAVELVLQTLRIGDVAICAIPCEVFVEIGRELRRRGPLSYTYTVQLANGYNGYLPTVEQHRLGGYETWRARSSYLEVEAAPRITAALGAMLDELE